MKTHLKVETVESCSGQWLQCAMDVFPLGGIDTFKFATSIKDLLIHGRGKNRNLIIIGQANCARTFMLKPLKLISSDSKFENPANQNFGAKTHVLNACNFEFYQNF